MSEQQYNDIAPFDADIFDVKMRQLVDEPGFEHAIRYIMPEVDYEQLKLQLLSVHNTTEFQHTIMFPVLERLAKATTGDITSSGLGNIDRSHAHVYMTNHRDIVLDASFLNLCFLREGIESSEIALGDNLLIYDWIESLVKLNKGFIVKRNLRMTKAFEAAIHLSDYIHHTICDKNQSIWIAQREGRAKDSNDRTQDSLIKMLMLRCPEGGTIIDSIRELHITPTAIAYEYDPTDYLKVREYLLRRRDPEFRKSAHDDLLSMETGIVKYHGRVHFGISECINGELATLEGVTDKNEVARAICDMIDRRIYLNYRIYPINYIALDMLEYPDAPRFAGHYSEVELSAVSDYFNTQLDRVDVEGITGEEREFMMRMMLTMYSNPLRNQLAVMQK